MDAASLGHDKRKRRHHAAEPIMRIAARDILIAVSTMELVFHAPFLLLFIYRSLLSM
jgi:hypothetical protein